MTVTLEFISGVSFGIQVITKEDLGEGDAGWYLIIELGIVRIILDK